MMACITAFTRVGMLIFAALAVATLLPYPFGILSWLLLYLSDPIGELEKWYKEYKKGKNLIKVIP